MSHRRRNVKSHCKHTRMKKVYMTGGPYYVCRDCGHIWLAE